MVGAAVGAGTAVAPDEGTEVGAAAVAAEDPGAAVGGSGCGVAVADEPQAKIAASSNVNDPRSRYLGFLNQLLKMDHPPINFGTAVIRCPRVYIHRWRGI